MSVPGSSLAIDYLRALSVDVRGVAVRGGGGVLLAGEEVAGEVVRALDSGHEVTVAVGPYALPALAAHDAERALELVVRPPSAT
jgi:hypothetical protein